MVAPVLSSVHFDDGKKVKIAAIDPDFSRGFASVPDGIRWLKPLQIRALRALCGHQANFNHGLTYLAITSCVPEQSVECLLYET